MVYVEKSKERLKYERWLLQPTTQQWLKVLHELTYTSAATLVDFVSELYATSQKNTSQAEATKISRKQAYETISEALGKEHYVRENTGRKRKARRISGQMSYLPVVLKYQLSHTTTDNKKSSSTKKCDEYRMLHLLYERKTQLFFMEIGPPESSQEKLNQELTGKKVAQFCANSIWRFGRANLQKKVSKSVAHKLRPILFNHTKEIILPELLYTPATDKQEEQIFSISEENFSTLIQTSLVQRSQGKQLGRININQFNPELTVLESGRKFDLIVNLGCYKNEIQFQKHIISWVRELNVRAFRKMGLDLNHSEARRTKRLIQHRWPRKPRDTK